MSEESTFVELIRQVRKGDQAAAADLVRHYEPAIRRAVRFRLVDARMCSVLDSMDICQSVMASFFVRAASGQYEIDKPEQLLSLLVAMARNKLSKQVRRERAACRDNRRNVVGGVPIDQRPANDVSPSRQVAGRDLLQEVYRHFSDEERELVTLRGHGNDWESIVAQVGGNAVALRKKLSRALDRVTRQMGLEEDT